MQVYEGTPETMVLGARAIQAAVRRQAYRQLRDGTPVRSCMALVGRGEVVGQLIGKVYSDLTARELRETMHPTTHWRKLKRSFNKRSSALRRAHQARYNLETERQYKWAPKRRLVFIDV